MKKIYLSLLLLWIPVAGIIAQEAVSSAGNYQENAGISISWTLGEPVIETLHSENIILTQGFQQANITVTSVDEWLQLDFNITAYPNPASEILNIHIEEMQDKLFFTLYDLSGKTINSGKISGNDHQIDVSFLIDGTYFLRITSGTQMLKTFKIVKK